MIILQRAMYNKLKTQLSLRSESLVDQLERQVSALLNVQFITNNIQISEHETVHSIFIPSSNPHQGLCENYYVGHGFGGSALMSFMFIRPLMAKGNVILWEIRGMGVSSKLEQYNYEQIIQIQAFFLRTIEALLSFYKHKNCSFICHSFSSYLLLLFTIRFPSLAQAHIKRLLLLSPIGITTREEDYKNKIRGCSDVFYTILSKIGWAFNLTYKSPLRTICSCCKKSLVMDRIKQVEMTQPEREMLYRVIETFILIPDGSEPLFFKLFDPRVIPKTPLQPLLTHDPMIDIIMVYGGEADWVDKTGARRISQRFPERLKYIDIQNCGHNIPFDIVLCRELFEKYL